jgi:hypothetical protein
MCSGAFTFKNNGKYKVRFTVMNTDGKELKSTEWTTFESPFKNDRFGSYKILRLTAVCRQREFVN